MFCNSAELNLLFQCSGGSNGGLVLLQQVPKTFLVGANRLFVKKEEPRITKDFRGEGSIDFFAKPTKVHPLCQLKIWHPSTNYMACFKTTFSLATVQVAYGTSPSCWRQSKASGIEQCHFTAYGR